VIVVTKPPKKQPTPLCKWSWEKDGEGYRLVTDVLLATIKPLNDIEWRVAVKFGGKWHTGIRNSLEEAFRATDGLIAKKSKVTWLDTNVHVVIEPWMGDLNFDLDKPDE
jgi:hypothetical protein